MQTFITGATVNKVKLAESFQKKVQKGTFLRALFTFTKMNVCGPLRLSLPSARNQFISINLSKHLYRLAQPIQICTFLLL